MRAAASVPMKNHSTTAPRTASTTRKNGKPSRSLIALQVLGAERPEHPADAVATAIHARAATGGFSGSST